MGFMSLLPPVSSYTCTRCNRRVCTNHPKVFVHIYSAWSISVLPRRMEDRQRLEADRDLHICRTNHNISGWQNRAMWTCILHRQLGCPSGRKTLSLNLATFSVWLCLEHWEPRKSTGKHLGAELSKDETGAPPKSVMYGNGGTGSSHDKSSSSESVVFP